MIEKKFTLISNFDGLQIVGKIIGPNANPKGIFQICHGMAENRKRYYEFMRYLANEGYVCVCHDHRGHGESVKSKEDWGYFYDDSGQAIIDDAYQVGCMIKKEYPDLPLYLFGHSMGSMIVRRYLQEHDDILDKLIVCGSVSEQNFTAKAGIALVMFMRMLKGKRHRGRWLRQIVLGRNDGRFEGNVTNRWLCANLDSVLAYNEIDDCGFLFTNNGYKNLFTLMYKTYDKSLFQLKNKDVSILFIAGEDDPIILSKKKWLESQEFLKELGYHDVSGILYPGLRHEILQEKNKIEIYEDILKFIGK
ncbi:MAG: alpha/beta fold hydrolase [Erysipelotrichaceae bacterium]|nr:alpha/beta fold hydrolase [Erysipelotrichaceae bacterium]